jgi:hypothetical protein
MRDAGRPDQVCADAKTTLVRTVLAGIPSTGAPGVLKYCRDAQPPGDRHYAAEFGDLKKNGRFYSFIRFDFWRFLCVRGGRDKGIAYVAYRRVCALGARGLAWGRQLAIPMPRGRCQLVAGRA